MIYLSINFLRFEINSELREKDTIMNRLFNLASRQNENLFIRQLQCIKFLYFIPDEVSFSFKTDRKIVEFCASNMKRQANVITSRTWQHTMHWGTDWCWASTSACCRRGNCTSLTGFWTSCTGFNSSWSRVLWFCRGGGVAASCGRPLTCNDCCSSLHFVWNFKTTLVWLLFISY